ncbi:MAG: type II toxin-antitoxin system VapC family toxin [Burkholderiaceae bacterium]|nr:type II toxin-antitoxin system VapC family toxin [Burkholderiaceae bacterium]
MPVVVDASVVLAWLLPDEHSDEARSLIHRSVRERIRAPSLLLAEVANALRTAERRGRLRPALRRALLDDFLSLPMALAPVSSSAVLRADELAARHSLTVYDASYIELAVASRSVLATFDEALKRAAAAEGVPFAHDDATR